jgi:hypothetical protein
MSRSGYSDDMDDQWQFIRWRGAVASAFRGKRGVSFLTEMLAAMDALPEKRLITDELDQGGAVCAIGSVGKARGMDMGKMDPHEPETVAAKFGIAHAMASEIVWMNDEVGSHRETPEERFIRMRKWIKDEIWNARGCVPDPYSKRASGMSRRLHWGAVIEWNEV